MSIKNIQQTLIKKRSMYIKKQLHTLESAIIGPGRLLNLEKNSPKTCLFQPPLLFNPARVALF